MFPTIFEMVDYKQLNEIAAYGGFPTRYPYWRFGMEYNQLSKGYAYGLQKIYELSDAAEAHRVIEDGHVQGKLVLNI